MKKLLTSLSIIAAVAVVVVGATGAWFSDTEVSTGNTFTSGDIDMKIDFEGYYNKDVDGDPNAGYWPESDLNDQFQFFDFDDLKPGDYGEGTLSLHVYSNDSWGRMMISDIVDEEVVCTEPELEVELGCEEDNDGEIREALMFYAWLDQGETPGFQNVDENGDPILIKNDAGELVVPDPTEGDNIHQDGYEPIMISEGTIDADGEEHLFAEGLAAVWAYACDGEAVDGHNDYGYCHGIAEDGRLVGSTTYYMGVAWYLDGPTAGNEVQADTFQASFGFDAVQHRNNPSGDFGYVGNPI